MDERAGKVGVAALCAHLRRSGAIVVATETSYMLGVDPRSSVAVDLVYRLKGRAADAPLSLVVGSIREASRWIHLDGEAADLGRAFWPGPLTLVGRPTERALAELDARCTAGGKGVAVRVPARSELLALLDAWDGPLTATSANCTGAAEPWSPAVVRELIARARPGDVLFVDRGVLPGQRPSTLIDVRSAPPRTLRPGPISPRDVASLLSGVAPVGDPSW